jgi:hypothetical protein
MGQITSCCEASISTNEEIKFGDESVPLAKHERSKEHATNLESVSSETAIPISMDKEQTLNLIQEAYEKLMEIVRNGGHIEGLEQLLDKDGIKVYSMETPEGGTILKSEWVFPFEPKVFIEYSARHDLRKNWDTNIEQIIKVGDLGPGITVTYFLYKKIMVMSQREVLTASKKFQEGGIWYDVATSVESNDYPIKPDIVRAKVFMSGYILEPVQTPTGIQTKITSINHGDYGLNPAAKKLFKSFMSSTFPKYTRLFTKTVRKELGLEA